MTKQEFYLALCKEQDTYDQSNMTANEWYDACSHNITQDMDDDFELAANGDVQAIIAARHSVGLPPFC